MRSQYKAANFRLLDAYEHIKQPVLQMHGTLDQSIPIDSVRDISTRLANTRFVAIEGSDHHVHIDAPDQWLEQVSTFVDSLPP